MCALSQVQGLFAGRFPARVELAPPHLNGREVDADDSGGQWHVLLRHLQPTAGGGAEVEARARAGEEVILAVELDELEGRTRAVTLLLREVIELICGRDREGKNKKKRKNGGGGGGVRIALVKVTGDVLEVVAKRGSFVPSEWCVRSERLCPVGSYPRRAGHHSGRGSLVPGNRTRGATLSRKQTQVGAPGKQTLDKIEKSTLGVAQCGARGGEKAVLGCAREVCERART